MNFGLEKGLLTRSPDRVGVETQRANRDSGVKEAERGNWKAKFGIRNSEFGNRKAEKGPTTLLTRYAEEAKGE